MKLEEIRNAYEELSGMASKINRQLAFAGIGILWIFRVSTGEQTSMPAGLLWPAILLVFSLGIDILQYLFQSVQWYIFYICKKNKGVKENEEVNEPECHNLIAWSLFVIKIIAMLSAYWFLFSYLRNLLYK
jgi:hypothetical protein